MRLLRWPPAIKILGRGNLPALTAVILSDLLSQIKGFQWVFLWNLWTWKNRDHVYAHVCVFTPQYSWPHQWWLLHGLGCLAFQQEPQHDIRLVISMGAFPAGQSNLEWRDMSQWWLSIKRGHVAFASNIERQWLMMRVLGVPNSLSCAFIPEKDGDSPTWAFLSKDTSRFINFLTFLCWRIMDSSHGRNIPSLEGIVIISKWMLIHITVWKSFLPLERILLCSQQFCESSLFIRKYILKEQISCIIGSPSHICSTKRMPFSKLI